MRFTFVAQCEFEAQDLDDALLMLSNHFRSIQREFPDELRDALSMPYEGHMTIEPMEAA